MNEVVTRAVGIAFAFLRSLVQGWWAGVLAWLASMGIELSAEQAAAVEMALMALVFAGTVAAIRALETVRGDQQWQVWARRIGKFLMLGTSALQPTYQSAASDAQVGSTPRRKAVNGAHTVD